MKDALHIINQIKETSSRNEKEVILKQHKDNQTLRKVLDAALNPYVVFGIGEKKLKKFINKVTGKENKFNDLFEVIEYLKVHNTGTDHDVKMVAEFLNSQDVEELKEFYKEIITKTLKIGVTAKSINKAFGEKFIPEFNVMLAKKFEDEKHKIKGEFGVTLKLDGIRCLAIKDNGSINFFSRQGKPILNLIELIEDFSYLPDNMVYDGELLLVNDNNLSSDDLFRATQKVVNSDSIKKNVEFHIFDLLPLNEFKTGKSKKVYADRMLDLHKGLDISRTKFIKKVPILYWGKDKKKVYDLLDKVVADGKEGLMVSNGNGFYVTKRTDNLLKVKKFNSSDGIVVDIYEGEGKYKGKLGGVIITYKEKTVKIGSGFSDWEREFYWNNPNEIIGKVGQYNYFEESKNQKGDYDLRFATWKGLRVDKGVDDVNYE